MNDPDKRPEIEPVSTPEIQAQAGDLFRLAMRQLKSLSPEDISDNGEISAIRLARDLEAVGETEQALALYEAGLTEVATGRISTKHPMGTYEYALDVAADTARVGGDVDTVLEQLASLFTRGTEPEQIVATYLANFEHGSPIASQQKYTLPKKELQSFVSAGLIKVLIEQKPGTYIDPRYLQNREAILRDLRHEGISLVGNDTTWGWCQGAILAHKLGRPEVAERFIEQAQLTAQLHQMPLGEVMAGQLKPDGKPAFNSDIADALYETGRFKESARMLLETRDDLSRGNRWQDNPTASRLADVMPALLLQHPDDPETLELVKRYLKLTGAPNRFGNGGLDAKNHPEVNRGILRVALILQNRYGLELPRGILPLAELESPKPE